MSYTGNMKRIFSGVQATGSMHIGNYLGAIKPWVQLQGTGETIYFIPDLHTLNVRPKPQELRHNTLSTIAWLLAAGIDPERSIIFAQSQVHAHSELAIILENFVTMGELSRMTQYKDKAAKRGPSGELAALFTYPVLMAADILLYDANEVPVGDDQKQHVEIARDIAERFNNSYGETFVIPEPVINHVAARVMSLQNPESKMSKSDPDQGGNIMMLDEPEVIRKKISRAVTDSSNKLADGKNTPGVRNLLNIYAGFADEAVAAIAERYADEGYGKFKADLAEAVVTALTPVRERYLGLMDNPDELRARLSDGQAKASAIADAKVAEVRSKLGLI